MSIPVRAVPALLLVLFCVLGGVTILRKSPTFDETAHLTAGYYSLRTGRFDLYSSNPPLAKVLAATPLLALRPALPERTTDDHWVYAQLFQRANASRYLLLFAAGRVVILLLAAALGACVYAWTCELFGRRAAQASLLLFAFSPNLLAHSTLVTTDAVLALFFFVTLWLFDRACRTPSRARLLLTGAALGLALLSKFTALLLLPLLLALAALRLPPRRLLLAALIASLVTLATVNVGYLFRDVFYPFGGMVFQSDFFRALPGWLRLPIPADWLQGLDVQMADNQSPPPSYLLGRSYGVGGPWYYELVAFALKSTIPLLVLSAVGAVLLAKRRGREALLLLAPVATLFLFVSLAVQLKIGLRYVLPVYPFLMVVAGYGAVRLAQGGRLHKVLVGVLLAGHVVSSLAAFPHHLSYFNELVGGGRNGYRYLVDSNLDWGQDLPALRSFMNERGIERVGISYFGLVDPVLYGIAYDVIPEGPPEEGWYAISATHLAGIYDPAEHPLQTVFQGSAQLDYFRRAEPVEVLGNSIFMFRVPPQ